MKDNKVNIILQDNVLMFLSGILGLLIIQRAFNIVMYISKATSVYVLKNIYLSEYIFFTLSAIVLIFELIYLYKLPYMNPRKIFGIA